MSQTAQALKPPLHYYDRTEYLRKVEERKQAQTAANVGATAWLAGMTREEYSAKLAAEGHQPNPHKLYMHEQNVRREVEAHMEGVARQTYNRLVKTLPAGVKLHLVKHKAVSLENYPHLAYSQVGAVVRTNDDGTKTPVIIYAANFRADPKVVNGKQVFENIKPQVDGVNNEPMYFSFALDNKGQVDKRFGKDGVLFRLSDVSKVAESCVAIAPPLPTNRQTQERREKPSASFTVQPPASMLQGNRPQQGMAYR